MTTGTPDNSSRPQIELRCRVETSMLNLLRGFICSVARHLEFGENQVAEIEISVDEACANAMEHGYGKIADKNPQDILVEILYSGDCMTIRIVDFGSGTEASSDKRVKELEQYLQEDREAYRGLGYILMQKFMDKVEVTCVPGRGTTVEMTKIRQK